MTEHARWFWRMNADDRRDLLSSAQDKANVDMLCGILRCDPVLGPALEFQAAMSEFEENEA